MSRALNASTDAASAAGTTPSCPALNCVRRLRRAASATRTQAAGRAADALAPSLRRDDVARPAIFVGAGTCGLGAGARQDARRRSAPTSNGHEIKADVVEVGCIGLCSRRADRRRAAARPHAASASSSVTARQGRRRCSTPSSRGADARPTCVLGQHRSERRSSPGPTCPSWTSIRSSPRRPAGCWPTAASSTRRSIDEYIARGGYSALAKALRDA